MFIFVHFNETLIKKLLNRISEDYCKKHNISISSGTEINIIIKDKNSENLVKEFI